MHDQIVEDRPSVVGLACQANQQGIRILVRHASKVSFFALQPWALWEQNVASLPF